MPFVSSLRMGSSRPNLTTAKVVVTLERRPDGGLRAYSDDVPGFVLSHSDVSAVLADIGPALEVILSAMYESRVRVSPVGEINSEQVLPLLARSSKRQEYAAVVA